MTAPEAWHALQQGHTLTAEGWTGHFTGYDGHVYFSCGSGCCDNYWTSEEEFTTYHEQEQFTRSND
jgi:hypothetical protein